MSKQQGGNYTNFSPSDISRSFRVVRRFMGSGLLISVFGNAVVGGVLPAGIAIGALSIAWIPILRTVEGLEDLTSPLVARLLTGRDAGRTLVVSEGLDVLACVVALAAMFSFSDVQYLIAAIYILVVTPIPLFVDVAEELFAASLARRSAQETLAFNATVYSMIGLSSVLIATPAGSLLASWALPVTLIINLTMSALAVFFRFFAVKTLPRGIIKEQSDLLEDEEAHRHARQPLSVILAETGPGSPIMSGILGASAGVVGGYLVQWSVRLSPHPGPPLAALLVCVGAGATVGPQLARKLSNRGFNFSARKFLEIRLSCLVGVLVLSTYTEVGTTWALILMGGLILGISLSASGSAVIQATSRQTEYSSDRLAQMVGWSHSFAALGAIIGAWLGLTLSVQRMPTWGVLVAILFASAGWILLRRGAASREPSVPVRSGPQA